MKICSFCSQIGDKLENQSQYDPSRKTVGAIYREAQLAPHDDYVVNGDLTHELTKSLVDDLNDTIASNPYEGKPFYITIHESKDLLMKRCIKRRMITTKYRPYPEDDTLVFFVKDIPTNDVRFCWCLPHHTEMTNILMNFNLYEPEYVQQIRSWKMYDLHPFGFMKTVDGNWTTNPHYEDQKLGAEKKKVCTLLI